jgi:hypothetical protein
LARGKLSWAESIATFEIAIERLLQAAQKAPQKLSVADAPRLIEKCYSEKNLRDLYSIKAAYFELAPEWSAPLNDLVFLSISSILRAASHVGTAQWQYVLPNKTKARVTNPYEALRLQANVMLDDMRFMQANSKSQANLLQTDARSLSCVPDNAIDLVVTSPPYANNYDYADALGDDILGGNKLMG